MQRKQLASFAAAGCAIGLLTALAAPADATTMAYWRFEDGPDATDVPHFSGSAGTWSADILDSSGNNNHLSVWETGGGAGYQYRANVPASPVVQTGDANNFSVKNTGEFPAMWNESLSTWSPSAWSIEASFKLESGGYRGIVGRDSNGGHVDGSDDKLAALYFQKRPDESMAINYLDSAGYFHECISDPGAIQGFDFGSDPDGDLAPWYSAAAVCDGNTLSLYLMDHSAANPTYTLIAQTDLTASGSTDTSLSMGNGDGTDWDPGNFSVGRGMYDGQHGDRGYGYLDEIRISDVALATNEFLFASTVAAIPGDLNGDGYVGLDDLQPILDNWNQNVTVGDASMGDIAGPSGSGPDGYVGLDDLQPVLDHWNEGTPPTPSAVPEPASLMLAGLGGLALLRRRR